MTELTAKEIDEIAEAMRHDVSAKETTLPLRPPISKVSFSTLPEENVPRPLKDLSLKEQGRLENLTVRLDVAFGSCELTLKQIAALREGEVLALDQFAQEALDIYVNGKKIGRGEVVAFNGRFAIRLLEIGEKRSKMV